MGAAKEARSAVDKIGEAFSQFRAGSCDIKALNGVMDEAIERGGGGHLVAKDSVPLTEHQIARHHHRAALIPFGEEREQHLGLLRALLHVAEIVEQDDLEEVELPERAGQLQIALRAE